jgi:hypothetical protein
VSQKFVQFALRNELEYWKVFDDRYVFDGRRVYPNSVDGDTQVEWLHDLPFNMFVCILLEIGTTTHPLPLTIKTHNKTHKK